MSKTRPVLIPPPRDEDTEARIKKQVEYLRRKLEVYAEPMKSRKRDVWTHKKLKSEDSELDE
eukprot:48227-Eustigmatos_ZCMA.PRE.1